MRVRLRYSLCFILTFCTISLYAFPVEEGDVTYLFEQKTNTKSGSQVAQSEEMPISSNQKNSTTVQATSEINNTMNISTSCNESTLSLEDFNKLAQNHERNSEARIVVEGDKDSGYQLVAKSSNPVSGLSAEITSPSSQEVEENKKARETFLSLLKEKYGTRAVTKAEAILNTGGSEPHQPLSAAKILQVLNDLPPLTAVMRSLYRTSFVLNQMPHLSLESMSMEAKQAAFEQKKAALDEEINLFREQNSSFSQTSRVNRFLVGLLEQKKYSMRSNMLDAINVSIDEEYQGTPERAESLKAQMSSFFQQARECHILERNIYFDSKQPTLAVQKDAFNQEVKALGEQYPFLQNALQSDEWFLTSDRQYQRSNIMNLICAEYGRSGSYLTSQERAIIDQVASLAQQAQEVKILEARDTILSQVKLLLQQFKERVSAAYQADYGTENFCYTVAKYTQIGKKMAEYIENCEEALIHYDSIKEAFCYFYAIESLVKEDPIEFLEWKEAIDHINSSSFLNHKYSWEEDGMIQEYAHAWVEAKIQKIMFSREQAKAGTSDPLIADLWCQAINKNRQALECFKKEFSEPIETGSRTLNFIMNAYTFPFGAAAMTFVKSAAAVVQKITFFKKQAEAKALYPKSESLWEWNVVLNKTREAIELFDKAAELQREYLKNMDELGPITIGKDLCGAAENRLKEATDLAAKLSSQEDTQEVGNL